MISLYSSWEYIFHMEKFTTSMSLTIIQHLVSFLLSCLYRVNIFHALVNFLATCSCSDFVTPGGYGKCQKTYLGKPICYVNEPTTCADVVETLYPMGYSSQACLNYNGSNWFYKGLMIIYLFKLLSRHNGSDFYYNYFLILR